MRLLVFLLFLILISQLSFAQNTMSGDYTIGGSNPDFNSVQEAADSLMNLGIDGPTTFNIRPGTYEETSGSERVLFIDNLIPGISGTNMIIFQPDANAGGNVNNVIFQRTSEVGNPGGYVIEIYYGYVRLNGLTIQNTDTTSSGTAPSLIHIYPNINLGADSVFIENCRLIGNAGNRRSYDAIKWNRSFNNMRIINNTISGCNNGIRHWLTSSGTNAKGVIISNNYIEGLQRYNYGGSGVGGWGIRLVEADSAIISGNTLDYTEGGSGRYGISLGVLYSNVEKNKIVGLDQGPEFFGIIMEGDYNQVYNNMLAGLSSFVIYGIQSRGDYNEFYFNSISIPSRDIGPVFQSRYAKAFYLRSGSDNTIKNNIFINLSYNDNQIYVIHQYTSDSTNVFDSNILRYSEFNPVPQYPIKLARSGSDNYYTIPEWQATGNGLNSKYMLPEFTNIESDLHLGGCSVTNPDLLGLPISGINTDLDGDPRSAIQPMIGMDEATEFPQPKFSGLQSYETGLIPISSATLQSSTTGANHIVIANASDKNLQVYANDGMGNLSLNSSIVLPAAPTIIKTSDLDNDGNQDIITAMDSTINNLAILWGTAELSFEPFQLMNFSMKVEDIEIGDLDGDNQPDLVISDLGVVGVDSGFVQVIMNQGGRAFVDSAYMYHAGYNPGDLTLAYLNADTLLDVAVVDDFEETVTVFHNAGIQLPKKKTWTGLIFSDTYAAKVQSPVLLPGFNTADFDGDNDIDLLIDHANAADSLVLLSNAGDGTFIFHNIYTDNLRHTSVFDVLDYENDGDMDIIAGNPLFELTLYLNDGYANFEQTLLCYEGRLANEPRFILSAELDGDNLSDVIALPWTLSAAQDSLYTLMNLGSTTTLVSDENVFSPIEFDLHQNYPNPFNPSTVIPFTLSKATKVKIEIFNILGQKIMTLTDDEYPAGLHTVKLIGNHLAAGLYFYRMKVNNSKKSMVNTRRMLLVK